MSALDHAGLMDQVYRRQRHFYDITRKFYLLGRDPMLAGLDVPAGGSVLEIGCGTGRNLVRAARLYPDSRLFGIDISGEMLRSAGQSIANEGLHGRVRLALADAATFDAEKCFGQPAFDRILISYSLSMIPEWREVMRAAVRRLTPGGELHVVDFGDQNGLPEWFRAALFRWLDAFHVTPRRSLFQMSSVIAAETGRRADCRPIYRGYAWIATIRGLPRGIADPS
jgi:S-adenosylmethionine-diacylgycerolhomoserine-N-methlytransferase